MVTLIELIVFLYNKVIVQIGMAELTFIEFGTNYFVHGELSFDVKQRSSIFALKFEV